LLFGKTEKRLTGLRKGSNRYNNATIKRCLAVESNATACIAILKDQNTRNLLWTDRNHPGWYATQKRMQESEARLSSNAPTR
jgi:hypothetical protein